MVKAEQTVRANPGLFFIFLSVALDNIGLGLASPLIPRLMERYSGGTLDASQFAGLYISVYPAMQFFFGPLMGSLSDSIGRKKILLLSNIGKAVDHLLMAQATTLPVVFLARALAGVVGTSAVPASAYLADITPPEGRVKVFQNLGLVTIAAVTIGPALGGVLAAQDLMLPFKVAAYISFANFCLGAVALKESLPPEKRKKPTWKILNPIAAVRGLFAHPVMANIGRALFFYSFSQYSTGLVIVLFTKHRFGWGTQEVGIFLAVSTLFAFLCITFIGRIKNIPENLILRYGALGTAIEFALTAVAPQGWWLYALLPIGFYGCVLESTLRGQLTKHTELHGEIQGALSVLVASARIGAPLLMGWVVGATLPVPGLDGAAWLLFAMLFLVIWLLSEQISGRKISSDLQSVQKSGAH